VENNYKNSYYLYQNKTITKCGVDTPSKPNSEIPTYPSSIGGSTTMQIKYQIEKREEKRDTPCKGYCSRAGAEQNAVLAGDPKRKG